MFVVFRYFGTAYFYAYASGLIHWYRDKPRRQYTTLMNIGKWIAYIRTEMAIWPQQFETQQNLNHIK